MKLNFVVPFLISSIAVFMSPLFSGTCGLNQALADELVRPDQVDREWRDTEKNVSAENTQITGPVTLKDAVRFALEHSPTIDSSIRTRMSKELDRRNTVSKFFPQLQLGAQYGLQNQFSLGSNFNYQVPNSTAPWTSSLSATLSENLYDNGISITNNETAAINRDIAKLTSQKTRDEVIFNVMSEFYNYSASKSLLDVRNSQVETLRKQLKSVQSQYQQGFKTRSDFLRLKTQTLRAENDALAAEKTLALSAQNLRQLIGADQQSVVLQIVPLEVLKATPTLPSAAIDPERTYEFRLAKFQEQVSDKSVDLARRQYLPRVYVTSSLAWQNMNHVNSGTSFSEHDNWNWSALLRLEYDLLDWGQNKRSLEIARLSRMIDSNSTRTVRLDIETKIFQLRNDYDQVSRNHVTNRELLSLEEENYRGVERQYRAGQISYLDLITSLTTLQEARAGYVNSYFSILKDVAQYKLYAGTLSNDF